MKETPTSKVINNNRTRKVILKMKYGIDAKGALIKTINKWPATMFAAKRTERVKGRIILLINSIITIKGIKG